MREIYGRIKPESFRLKVVDTVYDIIMARSTRYLDSLPVSDTHKREVAEHIVRMAEHTSEQLKDKPLCYTSASWIAIIMGKEFANKYLEIPRGQL